MVTQKKTTKPAAKQDAESEPEVTPLTPAEPEVTKPEDVEPSQGDEVDPPLETAQDDSLDRLVQEVLNGRWGNSEQRRGLLTEAGHDYDKVQKAVNQRMGRGAPAAYRPSLEEVAREVIDGYWGDGPEGRANLEGAGYNLAAVAAEVDRLSR